MRNKEQISSFSWQSAVFILSFFSLYSLILLNDLSLKVFHSPSGRNSLTKLTGLFSLNLRSKQRHGLTGKNKRFRGYRYKGFGTIIANYHFKADTC